MEKKSQIPKYNKDGFPWGHKRPAKKPVVLDVRNSPEERMLVEQVVKEANRAKGSRHIPETHSYWGFNYRMPRKQTFERGLQFTDPDPDDIPTEQKILDALDEIPDAPDEK